MTQFAPSPSAVHGAGSNLGRHQPLLVTLSHLQPFDFSGWGSGEPRPPGGQVAVLTPPTSVAALGHGFEPVLHQSAIDTTAGATDDRPGATPGAPH